MASAVHSIPSIDEQFVFTASARKKLLILAAIGAVLVLIGVYFMAAGGHGHEVAHAADGHGAHGGEDHGHGYHWIKRVWANLWLNGVFFTGVSVAGMFFLSYNYLAQAGWSAVFKRVPEAMPAFLPVTGVVMLLTFIFGGHDLFHWTHASLYDPTSPDFDPIINGKKGFLNTPFYLIRMVIYFVGWYMLWQMMRKASIAEDIEGGLDNYHKQVKYGVIFLVFFAVTSSTSAWDFVMSIDTHWFSTMFGWYTLANWHVTGLATIVLIVVTLKENGYLKAVNASHLHDLGKFVFAFSIFWTYVWFAQFLLYYYANIPEEIVYFWERFNGYGGAYRALFFVNIIVNFLFPFLLLMTRDSKRTPVILKVACWFVVIGHYIDFFNNIMPGTVGAHGAIGPFEIGLFAIFAAGFIWSVMTQLEKAKLIAPNHPMLQESLYHDIE